MFNIFKKKGKASIKYQPQEIKERWTGRAKEYDKLLINMRFDNVCDEDKQSILDELLDSENEKASKYSDLNIAHLNALLRIFAEFNYYKDKEEDENAKN